MWKWYVVGGLFGLVLGIALIQRPSPYSGPLGGPGGPGGGYYKGPGPMQLPGPRPLPPVFVPHRTDYTPHLIRGLIFLGGFALLYWGQKNPAFVTLGTTMTGGVVAQWLGSIA